MDGEGDKMLQKNDPKNSPGPSSRAQLQLPVEGSRSCSAVEEVQGEVLWNELELLGKTRRLHTPHQSRENTPLDSLSHVRMTEIAPAHSRIFTDPHWKVSLSPFLASREERYVDNSPINRRIRSYYRHQDSLITAYQNLESQLENFRLSEVGSSDCAPPDNGANLAKLSLVANLVLVVAKAVAVAMSNSISIISSLVDSAVDLLSGLIIWFTSRSIRKHNRHTYPSGKNRLEPVAIVVLSVIMSLASFQLIIESIQKIVQFAGNTGTIPNFDIPTLIIACCTVVIKLVLFLLCYFHLRKTGTANSSISVLMQDHRNDCISNTFAAICGYLGSTEFIAQCGKRDVIYIDPVGAILIGAYIFGTWWRTGWSQVKMLAGHTASPHFLSKVTWLCLNHHPKVLMIDTVRAFHFGANFLVEVDLVLPEDMTLREAHNIGETLQQKLERMPEVERAFVHLDFETEHRPEEEHRVKRQ